MALSAQVKLFGKASSGHRKSLELDDHELPVTPARSAALEKIYAQNEKLRGLPGATVRRGWFTAAHLLLEPGDVAVDMGCEDGAMTYVMAAFNPDVKFIGIDIDKKAIAKAKFNYSLPNLELRSGDIAKDVGLEQGSVDHIIDSFILSEIFSGSRYNERRVRNTLDYHMSLLRPDGYLFMRDHALHHDQEFVLMEMPENKTGSSDIQKMSETELLLWYAERARPRDDPGCHGFFIEELPPRFPHTRLFRLPYKWAYEFIMRKDARASFRDDLHKEYAFFTEKEFLKTLRSIGARTWYSTPYWNDAVVNQKFEGRFKLFAEDGRPLGMPPTSFIVVAQKAGERKSLSLQERRPSVKAPQGRLKITGMRNDRTGQIVDVVSRDEDTTEIIPYCVVDNERLFIAIHEGVPRGIVNAVPRNSVPLDGRQWSGHMIEAIAVPTNVVVGINKDNIKDTVKFARDYLGLKPAIDSTLEDGRSYYPAPDAIDDLIKTKFLRVNDFRLTQEPKTASADIKGFTTGGRIRMIDAQQILDAITVGLVPNARLELQILELYEKLGLKAHTWQDCPLVLEECEQDQILDGQALAKLKSFPDVSFQKARGTSGQLRAVQSIFVDEGWVEGGVAGLASKDIEFIINENTTVNKAVILPLTAKAGEIMVGLTTEYLPVPQRHEGNGLTLTGATLAFPKEVTTVHQARQYVAEKFNVPIKNVWRMGESYFCHASVTPTRIFPFAVAVNARATNPTGGPFQFAPIKYVWRVIFRLFDHKQDQAMASAITYINRRTLMHHDFSLRRELSRNLSQAPNMPVVNKAEVITGVETATPPAPISAATELPDAHTKELTADREKMPLLEKTSKLHIK